MKLTDRQVAAFRDEGVLVAEEVVTEADLAPVIDEYAEWIDQRARALQAEGKITDLHAEEPFAPFRQPLCAVAGNRAWHGYYADARPRHLCLFAQRQPA